MQGIDEAQVGEQFSDTCNMVQSCVLLKSLENGPSSKMYLVVCAFKILLKLNV